MHLYSPGVAVALLVVPSIEDWARMTNDEIVYPFGGADLLRGINRIAVEQLELDSGLKLKGTYNRKLLSLVILKQN